jgi:hypothetical protein
MTSLRNLTSVERHGRRRGFNGELYHRLKLCHKTSLWAQRRRGPRQPGTCRSADQATGRRSGRGECRQAVNSNKRSGALCAGVKSGVPALDRDESFGRTSRGRFGRAPFCLVFAFGVGRMPRRLACQPAKARRHTCRNPDGGRSGAGRAMPRLPAALYRDGRGAHGVCSVRPRRARHRTGGPTR